MTFFIGRGFVELQILKKVIMALSLELSGIFFIGRGFAEIQILKKMIMALSLELSGIL